MEKSLVTMVLVLSQVSLDVVLSLNISNERGLSKEEAIFWMNTLCNVCRDSSAKSQRENKLDSTTLTNVSKHLSLEAYFTNQSRKPWDFFTSLSRHVSNNNFCNITISLKTLHDNPPRLFAQQPRHHKPSKMLIFNMKTLRIRLVILTVETLDILVDPQFDWHLQEIVIAILVIDNDKMMGQNLLSRMKNLLLNIWNEFGVNNVFIGTTGLFNEIEKRLLLAYDPFFKNKGTNTYGKILEINLNNQSLCSFNLPTNFHGYGIKVGLFNSPPAAVKAESIDLHSDVIEDFHGLDGHMLGTFVKYMNFQVDILGPSDGIEFGAITEDGTLTGTLGDVANRHVDISFNSQFLKKYSPGAYEIDAAEFSEPVDCDRVCIVVPAPLEIPRWLRTFHYFQPEVWICFIVSLIVASVFWRLMKHRQDKTPSSYCEVLLDTFMLFIGAPAKLQHFQAERMLVGTLLLLGMTVMGAFTGTLYHSFTNRMFYATINSLEELDQSGLMVGTATQSLLDVFGTQEPHDSTGELPYLHHLESKIKYTQYNASWPTIKKTALLRNIAAITRSSTFSIVRYAFVDEEGRSQLQLVDECPQNYYLSYLLPKNSFLKAPLDRVISILKEAGFDGHWKREAIRNLITRQIANHEGYQELEESKPFNVFDMQTCFLVLGIGLSISGFIFFGEILSYYLLNH